MTSKRSVVTVGDSMQGTVGHHAGHVLYYEQTDSGPVPVYCSGHAVSGQQTTGQQKVRVNGKAVAVVGEQGTTNCPCDGQGYRNTTGSSKVRVNGKPLVRLQDQVDIHGQGIGQMTTGSPKVRCT